ncbi:MAG TPA: DUF1801 domain-containing protein [Propionicimonas sp.]|uniref:DUF1801 domain-containing protein n=1 Tax=Propionicimonas sp. TaxID=1955623 RepID=UPI002F3E84AA
MSDASPAVDAFLAAFDHPHREGVLRLRAALLAAVPGLSEHIKWNAPSFVFDGMDRITFRLRPGDILQLVFHRGASVRGDVGTFTFDDTAGLLTWQTPDRGVITFAGLAEVEARLDDVADLARRWVLA